MRFLLMAILAMFMSNSYANIILHGTLTRCMPGQPNQFEIFDFQVEKAPFGSFNKPAKKFPADKYFTSIMCFTNISYDASTKNSEKYLFINDKTFFNLVFESKLLLKNSQDNYFSFEFIPYYSGTFSTFSEKKFVDFKVVNIKIDNKDEFILNGIYKIVDDKLIIQLNDARFKLEQSAKSPHILNLSMSNNIPVTVELQRIK